MMKNRIASVFLTTTAILLVTASQAQRDTTNKKKDIEITSSFKPILKGAAKINFNATPPSG
ncbi:MAG: hypothetical protein ABI480_15320, partial [Chitinophagaceae bacterium]